MRRSVGRGPGSDSPTRLPGTPRATVLRCAPPVRQVMPEHRADVFLDPVGGPPRWAGP